jgi:type II restriction enzyme
LFGQFLERCVYAKNEDQLVNAIIWLDSFKIKGLGPAVASIIYFLHPTIMPPFNTAIINGFNTLFKDRKKLGSWMEYLKIREVIIDTNKKHCRDLSLDLGAMTGLLFEIGTQKLAMGHDEYLSGQDKARLEKLIEKRHREARKEKEDEDLHSEMQYHLLKIGASLGYDVISAANDRSRSWNDNSFSFISLKKFPELSTETETLSSIKLIDVLWFEKGTNKVIAAFEVEKSTSIYSGILRLNDLSYTIGGGKVTLYLVIPDNREKDTILQLSRPAIKNSNILIKYICFSELRQHCDALCKFGDNHQIMEKIARAGYLQH